MSEHCYTAAKYTITEIFAVQAARLFSHPIRSGRPRSNTCDSGSSAATPPLSASDGSSISSGSQSSIDLGRLNALLASASNPSSGIARARVRARGAGHRRRISSTCVSRSSVYETIEEESVVLSSAPSPAKSSSPSVVNVVAPDISQDSVYIVDPESAPTDGPWDNEHGIGALRRYFALREEAQETVTASKKLWEDTPFSVFALQCELCHSLTILTQC